ncbi:uncharacterized protein LOC129912439 isoform X1 [Episyrphus balteatus]|uniref:uncharacterized protein LOC129912439 isoform X1 n=1 Tax=Episyrphus balteatus TaxID=286459 RepID=UPI002486795F|nr:uncharacterized protein LOC129912439 isoform X1 [Episyrphus balteatus]
MKLNKFFTIVTLLLFICAGHIPHANALIEDVIDVIHVTKEVATGILKTWDFVQQTSFGESVELPIIREKQKKVLRRMKELARKIDLSESRYANNIEWAIESINSFTKVNTRLELQMHEIDDIMNRIATRYNQMQRYEANQDKLEQTTLVTFAEWSVSPNAYAVNNLLEQLHLIFIGNEAESRTPSKSVLEMFAEILEDANNHLSGTRQSCQQFLYSLYADIALTELKGYTMMQFSWMILRIYGKGNFTQESDLMREDYAKRTERTLLKLREVMRRADRIVWQNDPIKHVKGKTYDEVTRLLQGYIENEVDLNPEETCRENCQFYEATKSYGCFKNLYCAKQQRCSGRLLNCGYVDSDMWICPSPSNSTRRYEYIEYESGRTLGLKNYCSRGSTKVDSWWRYIFWHCSYCFCICDEQGIKSDRYFNLRETVSNIDDNKVVTGLRFVKHKRVFHIQIQEGQLLPRGNVNQSTLSWKPVEDYQIFDRGVSNGYDYHTLGWDKRAIDLDDIEGDDVSHVVTGIRFRVVGAHLNLEARLSEYNFENGKLVNPKTSSFWKSNDNTDVSGERREQISLKDPDVPTRTLVQSLPTSRHNQYVEFTHTSMDRDAAQTTVPFIDIQEVTSNPPVPLAGVGLYHKGRNNYGGFIAPKLITYDFTPYVRLPNNDTK